MEKSIESIWKEGFLQDNAVVAPTLNNLYGQKSLHLIDRFQHKGKVNIWVINGVGALLLIASYFAGVIWAGAVLGVMLAFISWTFYKDLNDLKKIDKGENSYQYLLAFKNWLENSIERFGNLYRFIYPGIILIFYFGVWFSAPLSSLRYSIAESPDQLWHGVHIHSAIPILFMALVMSALSKRIHREDVGVIYGGIIRHLEEMLTEMEALQK